jgi:NDP-sugar pyrophosphorylase family protein
MGSIRIEEETTVDLGAILVVGSNSAAGEGISVVHEWQEYLEGNPIASIEVLGQSILQRTIGRLQSEGVTEIAVVSAGKIASLLDQRPERGTVYGLGDAWSAAQPRLGKYFESGCDSVLLIRLGAYVELELTQLLQFHREQRQEITPVYDGEGPVDYWLLDASLHRPTNFIDPVVAKISVAADVAPFRTSGYVNRLADARDLRQLVADSFLGRCQIRPNGIQKKPGVWVDQGAQIHRRARLVAPAYIGRNVKVQSDALITRCSSLERGCEVGYGTVVEDASILAGTYLGAGLDVTHAVVSGSMLVNLRHDVALQINDPQLLSGPKMHFKPAHATPSGVLAPVHTNLEAGIDGLRGSRHAPEPGFVASTRSAWAG